MMNKHLNLRMLTCGIALALSTLISGTALAQKGKEGNGDKAIFKISGTIKAIVPGYLQVETEEKEVWVVQILPLKRSVRFIGSAEADWLMPGMWVNFTTTFNAKGQAVAPIKLLTVFTPGTPRGRDVEPYSPGVKSLVNPGAAISFSGEEKVKAKVEVAPFEVTGQLKSINKSGLTVQAGNIAIQVPLAEEASISVDVADLRPTRVGDKVEVTGGMVAPLKGIAARVEVKGANPLSSKPMAATENTKPVETKTVAEPETETEKTPETPAASGKKKLPLLGQKPAAE